MDAHAYKYQPGGSLRDPLDYLGGAGVDTRDLLMETNVNKLFLLLLLLFGFQPKYPLSNSRNRWCTVVGCGLKRPRNPSSQQHMR